jgi:hypothetical protein
MEIFPKTFKNSTSHTKQNCRRPSRMPAGFCCFIFRANPVAFEDLWTTDLAPVATGSNQSQIHFQFQFTTADTARHGRQTSNRAERVTKYNYNRELPTQKVLELLKLELPSQYELAEIVGKWIWIDFPAATTTRLGLSPRVSAVKRRTGGRVQCLRG